MMQPFSLRLILKKKNVAFVIGIIAFRVCNLVLYRHGSSLFRLSLVELLHNLGGVGWVCG